MNKKFIKNLIFFGVGFFWLTGCGPAPTKSSQLSLGELPGIKPVPDIVAVSQNSLAVPEAVTLATEKKAAEVFIKRDPFSSVRTAELIKKTEEAAATGTATDIKALLHFQGVWDNGQYFSVIINEDILKEGDKIYNYVIKKIYWDRVVLSDGTEEVTLYLEEAK